MFYSIDHAAARRAVREAKQDLRKWERRFDHNREDDQTLYVAEFRIAEECLAAANSDLRKIEFGAGPGVVQQVAGYLSRPAGQHGQDLLPSAGTIRSTSGGRSK